MDYEQLHRDYSALLRKWRDEGTINPEKTDAELDKAVDRLVEDMRGVWG